MVFSVFSIVQMQTINNLAFPTWTSSHLCLSYKPSMSQDDGSCCSTWTRGSSDARFDQVRWSLRRAGISARCCLSCCHTSSGEGADGLRTRRSVVSNDEGTEVFHSVRWCCADYPRELRREVRGCIGTKKLDLKSNCATSTPYIVSRVSHY